jgi:hypothetical protein
MTDAHPPAPNNYRLYISLLKEIPAADPAWKHHGKVYSAAELLDELEHHTAAAEQYARTILYYAMEGLLRPTKLVVPGMAELDLTVWPGASFIEQFRRLPPETPVWRTMSWTFTAGEMPGRIEALEPDAMTLLSDVMRITRDRFSRDLRRPTRAVPD